VPRTSPRPLWRDLPLLIAAALVWPVVIWLGAALLIALFCWRVF
jgi:hypothetical protein